MALQKDFKQSSAFFNGELVARDCYWRVDKILGNGHNLSISVNGYAKDTKKIIASRSFDFAPELEGKNFIAQAYDHLKTLPAFENAVDC
jgi:hypothetical protein